MKNNEPGSREEQAKVTYSSSNILNSSAVRNRNRLFGRVKAERIPLKTRLDATLAKVKALRPKKDTADTNSSKRKRQFPLPLLIILAACVVTGVLLSFIFSSHSIPDDKIVSDDDTVETSEDGIDEEDYYFEDEDVKEEEQYGTLPYSWSEELLSLSSEADNLIAEGNEEAYQKAWDLYEARLTEVSSDPTQYLNVLLSYATHLAVAGKVDEARAALARVDIESYEQPESDDLTQYLNQKTSYYATMAYLYEASGDTAMAEYYNQRLTDLSSQAEGGEG